MTDKIKKIDYSLWDSQTKGIAKRVDKDKEIHEGLNGFEIFDFAKTAKESNVDIFKVYELLGLKITDTRSSNQPDNSRTKTDEFKKAIEHFNSLDYFKRGDVIDNSFKNLEVKLYNMECDISDALKNCKAYSDIIVMARWHYRHYPYHYTPVKNDPFMNFDIDEIRTRTTDDMKSIDELKYNVECAIEKAKGNNNPKNNFKSDYDVDKIAEKYLGGLSYKKFAEKYKDEIEFCKHVTYADYTTMTQTQRDVYGKLRNYAIEMLNTTIVAAQMANIDANDRKTEETLKATNDMITLMDFQYEDITNDGLNKIQSDITYNALEETLINSYRQTGIKSQEAKNTEHRVKKVIDKNRLKINSQNGKEYDFLGREINS